MLRYLHWVFRPIVLIAVSLVLVGLATFVVLPPREGSARPQPLPVAADEQEIAWLYPATSSTTWERLALALQQAALHLQDRFPGLECEQDSELGTSATTPPQLALRWPRQTESRPRRLVFRWYKLTSQWSPHAWIEALTTRNPPPLAIIGGNNSYWARELAVELARETSRLPKSRRPLLLLTTATADRVLRPDAQPDLVPTGSSWDDDARTIPLHSIYPGHTFRFCFSNRQMATAVTRYIWSRPDLRPECDPAYLVQWTDDSYSQDLCAGSVRVLDHRAADNSLEQWAYVSGCIGLGAPPMLLAGWFTSGFRKEEAPRLDVDSSVGSFSAPNPYEAKVVRDFLAQVEKARQEASPTRPFPRRPLLVLTGQLAPSRRFLRDLARSAPDTARRFVVAMGDAISFNTIYRDRQVTWPIQDLPFTLVFFSHHNPIDAAAGFHPSAPNAGSGRAPAAGTEDVLLFRDIAEVLSLGFQGEDGPCREADDLARGLRAVRLVENRLEQGDGGFPLFGPDGQRSGGSGEHVVQLSPTFLGDRVLPRATIEVWARQGDRTWKLCEPKLSISYDEFEVQHGDRLPAN